MERPAKSGSGGAWWVPPGWLVAGVATLAAMVAAMRWEGRLWVSASGRVELWHGDVWSSECSQQLLDPYSITHVSHGFFFAGVFWLLERGLKRVGLARGGLDGGSGWGWPLAGSVVIAAGWEVLENSPIIIERYRTVTMSLDYLGDSVVNSVGDVLCCAAGFFVARWLGAWRTLALFVATELLLLWMIRDNLTLNVVMLVHPVESIKAWQSALAPGH